MHTFHYLPPGAEEQRGFVLQLLGTFLGVALVAVLWWWTHEPLVRGVLLGASIATVIKLAHAAWQLEQKAQRSQFASVGVDDEGLRVTSPEGQTQSVQWQDVIDCRVVNGRLTVVWPSGQLAIGAREMQNGMELVQEVTRQWTRHTRGEADSAPVATNFIPLLPKEPG